MTRAVGLVLAVVLLVGVPTAGASVRGTALQRLAHLHVAASLSHGGYDRDLFPHWRDPDGNGCNARQDALLKYGRHVEVGASCRILSGSWRDPYSGSVYGVARTLDCDHIVPLANAWISGARRWSSARRARYANDPLVLLITSAHLNRQKSDAPPQRWKPPRHAYWVTYAARWIKIKARYHLTITRSERTALRAMLRA